MRIMALIAALMIAGCHAERGAERANEVDSNIQTANAASEMPKLPRVEIPVRTSEFTRLDPAVCRTVEENRDEGPYWRRRCPGAGGFSVDWTDSDLRQALEIISAGGERTNLRLSELVAKGVFNHLGPRIEWRGVIESTPDMLVVRLFVANGAEPTKPDRSLLAVARLQPKPCIIAIVEPSPQQSDQARRIADSDPTPCLV